MARNYSFKLSDELDVKIEEERVRKKVTYTDVIRTAVEEYFYREKQRAYGEALLAEMRENKFETIKSRSVMLQCLGKELTEQMVKEAEEDADAYLQERKQ